MNLSGFPKWEFNPATRAGASTITDDLDGERPKDGFASIGLPAEAGWYVSAALYWIAGLSVVLIDQLAPRGSIDPVIGVLGTLALAASPLMLLGARFAPTARWGTPVRIFVPSILFVVGSFVIGDAINALVLFLLFPVLAVAYMHRPTVSIPYCSLSLLMMAVLLLVRNPSDAGTVRIFVLTAVCAAVVSGLILMQHRLRQAAALNHGRSITDPLTGLVNLRGLRTRLDQEIQRSTRDSSGIVMFAIDLDDFKEVNDRFSYALGDAVLQAVAQALTEELEPGDLLVRRGGDEFAILTLEVPGRHLARFGDRIAGTIERTRRAICPAVNPRASITRVRRNPGEGADAFLRRVDDGLHSAKVDAHPERDGVFLESTDEHFAVQDEQRESRMLAGARRAQINVRGASHRGASDDLVFGWWIAAGTSAIAASIAAVIAASGLLEGAWTGLIAACVGGLALTAISCALAARSKAPRRFMHLAVASTLGLSLLCVAAAGPERFAMADLLVLPVPLAVILLGWRRALPYAVLASLGYAYFVIGSGKPFSVLVAALMIGVMTVLMALLARGDRMADEFSAQAEALSIVDPLTGAANLRGFDQRLQHEVARSDALGDELCLTMIDLVRFKDVNDLYSHSMGDALLIETTRAIESVVREDELVVRRGGDEFVVVCAPGVRSELDALSARLAEAILSARVRLTPEIIAGATIVNVFRHPGESAAELAERADEELRLAKARGGHRIAHR